MKKIIVSIVFIVICGTLFSQQVRTVEFDNKYEIKSSGKTSKVVLTCLVPQNIDNVQKLNKVEYSTQPDTIFIKNGNKYAEFTLNKPARKEMITVSVNLDIYVNDISTRLKNKISLNDNVNNYLINEVFIEKDNATIKRKARELKDKDTLQTIENTFLFVKKTLKYSGYNPADIGALKALRLRKGDCTEFSDLFVALCRANNIPARVIDGYTPDYDNTPKHNWAEVYISNYGWVRIDPTPDHSLKYDTTKNNYIQLSQVRNDKTLNNFHFMIYNYWGGEVEITDHFELKK